MFSRYVEAVLPGEYGIPLSPWFLVTKSYWCGTPSVKVDDSQEPRVSQFLTYGRQMMLLFIIFTNKRNFKRKRTPKISSCNISVDYSYLYQTLGRIFIYRDAYFRSKVKVEFQCYG